MSTAPPPAAPAPTPAERGRPAPAPVIRRVGGAYDQGADRLLTRTLPAWVISGALNLGLIALAWLVFGFNPTEAKPAEKVLTTSVEREPEDSDLNLTNDDKGLQSNIDSALPDVTRLADKTADELIVSDDAVGTPDTARLEQNSMKLPGLPTQDMTGGALGLTGDALAGAGGANGNIAAGFVGRSAGTKSRLLREGGGNEESELAVAMGLKWLAEQQKTGGYWEFDPTGDKARKLDRTTATGLALLPFLAAGQTHKSGGKYTQKIQAGLKYLTDNISLSTGKFNSPSLQYMYGHGIATIALCEAYGMTKDKALLPAARAAVAYIVKAQAPNGSWGYSAGVAGDTSIVGWQVQALKAAQLAKDISVPKGTIDAAVKFLNEVSSGSQQAVYGYASKGGQPGTSLTAVGLLCRYYIDAWGPNKLAAGVPGLFGTPNPGAKPDEPRTKREKAPKTRDEVKKNGTVPDMYYFYYATQVVHFFEGPEWKEWNEGPKGPDGNRQGGMRDWMVAIQKKDGANRGSWEPDGAMIGNNCGRLGTTCLCLLTLEVYYRHLPLYKRDQGGVQVMDLK